MIEVRNNHTPFDTTLDQSRKVPVIRGDWEGFALYLEQPDSIEPGEFVAVFNTLTGAARAAAAAKEALGELARLAVSS